MNRFHVSEIDFPKFITHATCLYSIRATRLKLFYIERCPTCFLQSISQIAPMVLQKEFVSIIYRLGDHLRFGSISFKIFLVQSPYKYRNIEFDYTWLPCISRHVFYFFFHDRLPWPPTFPCILHMYFVCLQYFSFNI